MGSVGQSKNAKRTALAHSVFNITGSMVFIWVLVKIVNFIVRGEDATVSEGSAAKYLDYNVLAQPAAAVKLVTNEVAEVAASVGMALISVQKSVQKNNAKKC